jgi:transposase
MAFREVTMFEIKEVLRLWITGTSVSRIASAVGIDRKTVRRYLGAARNAGLSPEQGEAGLTDECLAAILIGLKASAGRPHGESWARCEGQRAFIAQRLNEGLRLSKIRRLLRRHGVEVAYPTLHRFAVIELGFGRRATTIPVADGEPGHELQLDTGWVGWLEPDLFGKRRRFRAWIFTAVRSRHRFAYPCFHETTHSAIAACEAAWEFFGGVFHVLLPDNTKTIIDVVDPLQPRINQTFLEYAQARGFHIDPARVRSPRDKARVERAVPTLRDDCFAGEHLQTIEDARALAHRWCLEEYGRRRHSTTYRLPLEHFEAEEKPCLLPAPSVPYDVPLWCSPKVARDQHAQVAKALYSLPSRFVGRILRARADSSMVRFYDKHELVKVHPRRAPGQRSTDPADFPQEKTAYALRDVAFLKRQAEKHGEAVGRFAQALLDCPLPWTRMRRVYALLSLAKRYGELRVNDACAALAADMLDVRRLGRMLKLGDPAPPQPPPTKVIPLARYLRPASQYALSMAADTNHQPQGED